MLMQALLLRLNQIWRQTRSHLKLSLSNKFFFFLCCCLEPAYRAGFFLHQSLRKYFFATYIPPFTILSVGNISSGGTGKSIFVKFLIFRLKRLAGAIITKGYKGLSTQKKQSSFLSPNDFCDTSQYGDEACMLLQQCFVPVVVGKSKKHSAKLLEEHGKVVDFAVLDDAYQNHELKKKMEIILLDARWPFENNHCLPAGPLREKNVSRADVIILTHADEVDEHKLKNNINAIRKSALQRGESAVHIFNGRHKAGGLFFQGIEKTDLSNVKNKRVGALAGIGSFSGFLVTLEKCGFLNVRSYEYVDHHTYTKKDIDLLKQVLEKKEVDCFITTRKDWVKLQSFFYKNDFPFYVLDVDFEFLSKKEDTEFFKLMERKLGWHNKI